MPAPHNSADTPVMRQFLEVKARHPDAIVMFRMGDFYEMFFEDAVAVAPVLDIALTSRDKGVEDPVPMAGVPYHALGGYLRTLVERGFKVAICEQLESPEDARRRKGPGAKIVKRDVVRVVTPGALLDEEHLRGEEPNYLAAVSGAGIGEATGPCSLACYDLSTSDFLVVRADSWSALRAELSRLAPREVLADAGVHDSLRAALAPEPPRLEPLAAADVATLARVRALAKESGLQAIDDDGLRAAAAVLAYAEATQPGQTLLVHRLRLHEPAQHLVLDEASLRNLEVLKTMRDGSRRGSLLWSLDATRTSMGARSLRAWIGAPSRDRGVIAARQDAIDALVAEARVRETVQSQLKDVRDVVRLTARTRLGTVTPRELGALRASLAALPALAKSLAELARRRTDRQVPAAIDLGDDLLHDVLADLAATLVDDPPAVTRDGGMIRDGADDELDEQRRLRDGGQRALAAIEARERERTQIPTLKVQHNRVFGYFLEVSRAHLSKVPSTWVRKQTIAGGERFVTEELAGHEAKVLAAHDRQLSRELELFVALRGRVSAQAERLVTVGERIAAIDVLAGLAELAARHDWVRPELVEEPLLALERARHPVVERMLETGRFVPNDTFVRAQAGGQEARLLLVTGPNMGGKSTVIRQAALVTLMAHMGSFVPAARARVGLCDRIFTRVGAADDLGRGESTFMVEMRETAQILERATAQSLVLLDEVGRGTATFDGLSLAWAIVEHLHDQIGARALFATHYHELCALEGTLAGVRNVHVAVHEDRGRILFLHQLAPGPAGRSYGIAVGRLAGLPARVLRRATRILERLEADHVGGARPQLDLFAAAPSTAAGPEVGPAASLWDELGQLDLDAMTPRDAHAWLAGWVERARRS
ncbi:MAG: DNA mismatch repair protein MutS [Deltaproteobacteria bacterium]|nr:DNA mismatch repair protein MutS [Deltaproteobacteria bacterium]